MVKKIILNYDGEKMLTKEQEEKIYSIAKAFESLYNSREFSPLRYAMRIWHNYELLEPFAKLQTI